MTREDKKKSSAAPIGMTSFVSFAVPLIFRSSFSSLRFFLLALCTLPQSRPYCANR